MTTLTKVQIEKLQEIEMLYFDESIRLRELRDAVHDNRFTLFGDGEMITDINGYMEKLGEYDFMFFNMACCTRMVDQETVIMDDGSCTMTWRVEWDHETINSGAFKDGCLWANEQGAEIPIKEGE